MREMPALSLSRTHSSLAVVSPKTDVQYVMQRRWKVIYSRAAGYNGSRHVHLENILPCIEGTARAHIYRAHTLWARLPSPKRDPNNISLP